jgi:hypothetical protein
MKRAGAISQSIADLFDMGCPAAWTIPGESREITLSSLDIEGLMDQLDDLFPGQ